MLFIFYLIVAILLLIVRANSRPIGGDWSVVRGLDDDNMNNFWGVIAYLFILGFIFAPAITLALLVVVIVGAILYRIFGKNDGGLTRRRKEALARAKVFLSPYTDIWKSLTLSNKYCSLKLGSDGVSIHGFEKKTDKKSSYRTFRIATSNVFDYRELWNLFCLAFTYNKTYEGLLEDCSRFKALYLEEMVNPNVNNKQNVIDLTPKVDINNASEAEITALPGISIVIAKKLIKKREAIGGFKNVEEVLLFVKLKPNVTEQLRQRICVNKMKGCLKITRSSERTIDL